MKFSEIELILESLDRLTAESDDGEYDLTYLATHGAPGQQLVLEGNYFGLLHLAAHLVVLAKRGPGAHLHLDERSELEKCEGAIVIVNSTGD